MKTIAVIAARGGSKGIPNKNLINFCGKPLLHWSVETAIHTPEISSVWVSTDDASIAKVAAESGAGVIMRPQELSGDVIMPDLAWLHTITSLSQKGEKIDCVMALQATSPVRLPSHLSNGIHDYKSSKADSLFSASKADDICLWRHTNGRRLQAINFDPNNRQRRQDGDNQYVENGSFYIFTPETITTAKDRFHGDITFSVMPKWASFEIDETEDIDLCEYFMMKKILS